MEGGLEQDQLSGPFQTKPTFTPASPPALSSASECSLLFQQGFFGEEKDLKGQESSPEGPGEQSQARTGVEEDNGSQAAQLCLVHQHVPHFGHQFCQYSAKGQRKHRVSTEKRKGMKSPRCQRRGGKLRSRLMKLGMVLACAS